MANNVKTVVRLEGNHAVLEKLLRKVVSSATYILKVNTRNNYKIMDVTYAVIPRPVGKVDFNILVPQPPFVYQGAVNNEIKKDIHGVCWDDWREKNWGTTRNAHNDSVEWLDENTVQITVWTDWTRPTEWLNALAKEALKQGVVDISGEYANEDFGCEMGYIHIDEEYYKSQTVDPLCFAGCDQDVECYNMVWGEGMAETTGYFNDDE